MLFVSLYSRSSSNTAEELSLLCGSLQFCHELAPAKKSQDDDNKTFNLYDFCLYGLRCADEQDVK